MIFFVMAPLPGCLAPPPRLPMHPSANVKKASTTNKTLYLVRHGTTLANEFMDANPWGTSAFADDGTLRPAGYEAVAS